MGLKHKKAVIFDLDGTLVDSMWMWKSIDVEYLDRYGYDCPGGPAEVHRGHELFGDSRLFQGAV